ncbi:unnamed protein product, partial [Prorocentrum cordatum]
RPGPGRRRVGDAALHRPSGGPGPEPRRRGGRAAPDAEGSGAGPRGPRRGARRRRASQAPAAPGRRGGGEAPRGGVGRASGHQEVHRGGGGLQEDRGRLSWALHGAVQNSNENNNYRGRAGGVRVGQCMGDGRGCGGSARRSSSGR